MLEDVVSRFQQVAVGKDVVIVEGMVPTRESNYTQRINTQLESAGLKVGFFKPIAQPFPVDQGRERSCILVERTLNLTSPEPLPLEQVERQLA
ncbi:hypothetical protein, partial [Acinetobacter baumannii]|uniref:hypothetical protein n=1 Tax=Acinetobacter baumannii TaxID=470 RepID=UPI001D17953D